MAEISVYDPLSGWTKQVVIVVMQQGSMGTV